MTLLQRLDNLILEAQRHPSPADEHLQEAHRIYAAAYGPDPGWNFATTIEEYFLSALELLIRERNALYPALDAVHREVKEARELLATLKAEAGE